MSSKLTRQSRISGGLDYPMHSRPDPQDQRDLVFTCEYCQEQFAIDSRDYRGQFDHEPNVPVCPECQEEQDES